MLWLLHPSWSPAPTSLDGEDAANCPLLMVGGGLSLAVVAVITLVLNALLVIAVLVNRQSRSLSFPLHIVNLAAASILQGAGILPLWSFYLIAGTWHHGDDVCRWWLAADVMATSASALAIIFMACDRFVYLVCWKHVQEGSKYILCSLLLALAWLLALGLTLTVSLTDEEETGTSSSRSGLKGGNHCLWSEDKRGTVAIARVVVYSVGAGLGAGLSLALTTLSCLARGVDVLPIEEDDWERETRALAEEDKPLNGDDVGGGATRPLPVAPGQERHLSSAVPKHSQSGSKRTSSEADRFDERERWRGQVASLVVVAVVWALMWLPSHLFIFADILGLDWQLRAEVVGAFVVMGYANAAVTPLLWLLHKPIRSLVADTICCRCCQIEEEGDDDVFEEDCGVEFQELAPCRPPLPSNTVVRC